MTDKKLKDRLQITDGEDIAKLMQFEIKTVDCFVIVEATKKLTRRRISTALLPPNATRRRHKGRDCYLLGVDKTGKLFSIEPSNEIIDNDSPKDLYDALECSDEIDEMYGMEEPLSEKIKTGLIFALCGGLIFVLFIISIIVLDKV